MKLHVGGRVHLLREPLQSLVQRLDPSRFARAATAETTFVTRPYRLWRSGTGSD